MRAMFAWLFVVLCVPYTEGAIAVQDASVEYLSGEAMPRILILTQGWGVLGQDTSAHAPGQQPLPLRIADREYERGLGHHAPGSILVALDGEYQTFEAEVGVQWQGDGAQGSVVFQVLVDGEIRFESDVMRHGDPPRVVTVDVSGAQELELSVGDAGDGINCDCADWAEARLTRAPDAVRRPFVETFDVAPFARLVTCDPSRTDGARASRIQEFLPGDVFLETEVARREDGSCVVPTVGDGQGCIGLVWPERRVLSRLTLTFAQGSAIPPAHEVAVEAWIGESPWQGDWTPMPCTLDREGSTWTYRPSLTGGQPLVSTTRKVRWVFPSTAEPIALAGLSAFTRTRTEPVRIRVELASPLVGRVGDVEVYNGALVGPDGDTYLSRPWDLSGPLSLEVIAARARLWKADRTLLRFRLPGLDGSPERGFSVAVDDLIEHGCVALPDLGFYAALESYEPTLAEYQDQVIERRTVLERVRRLPDQTLAKAWDRVHNPLQRNGPTMVSLACDNRKFIVGREGAIQFSVTPNQADSFLYYPLEYPYELRPTFGVGPDATVTRELYGGWLPAPVTMVEVDGLFYRQRTYVAPLGGAIEGSPWLRERPLCVAEFTIENPTPRTASAQLRIACAADVAQGVAAEWRAAPSGALAVSGERVLCAIDASAAGPLSVNIAEPGCVLTGDLAPGARARCYALLPAWPASEAEAREFRGDERLLESTRDYWEDLLADAMQIDLPDGFLTDVIRSSQVRCLIAARNEDAGARVAPWIAANTYGPLESEANTIVSGMDLMGHHDFAQRCLDFFIARYSPEGFLTTGYTLIGTGWQLDTLGEHLQLTQDRSWMRRVAPEVARAAGWIARQREMTKRRAPDGSKVPEYGLVPPGVTADWGVFSYRHYNQAHYWAGLSRAAAALAAVGHPEADGLLASASEFRQEIRRAYRLTQSQSAAMPLSDGTWVPGSPSTVECFGLLQDWFPGEDGNRSWAYDVEIGAHHLIALGVLDPDSLEARWLVEQLEDAWLLDTGMGDYTAERNHADWFSLGGFAKVQPYYARLCEVYALQDEVKPFIRAYLNAIPSLLNPENLTFWEHFRNQGAWDKTHETGEFLRQTRLMLVMERGDELWLAPFVTSNWLRDGMVVSVAKAPTYFGPVSYTITSAARRGRIEARIAAPQRAAPDAVVIRLRHPDGKRMRAVTVNGEPHGDFDPRGEWVRVYPDSGPLVVVAEYE